MDIQGKTIMVLGGYGQVGLAISRELLAEGPQHLILTSLRPGEVEQARAELEALVPSGCRLTGLAGNIYVRWDFKNLPPEEIARNPAHERRMLEDFMAPLDDEILTAATLYRLIQDHRPDIVIDCINTATAIAYQNIYHSYTDVSSRAATAAPAEWMARLRRLVATVAIPPLVRHVQILFEALRRAGTGLYLKVGTTGTGGMGMNIPFTHGEEQPSRLLLTKSAVAGAHSQLLLIMSLTPGGPVVKEIKPAALIGWKAVGKGPISKKSAPVPLYDCPVRQGYRLVPGAVFDSSAVRQGHALPGRQLTGVYVDTGENGVFCLDEFKAVTALGLMEFVTPEEIATDALLEIKGLSTARDVIGALAGAVMGSSYRAGLLRQRVIQQMETLGAEGIPYTLLGPRIAKLILEAHLLKLCYGTVQAAGTVPPGDLARRLDHEIEANDAFRQGALSVGIPILMADGQTLLFASRGRPERAWEDGRWTISPEQVDRWAASEWVDLRPANMALWQTRLERIRQEENVCLGDTSSCYDRGERFWSRDTAGHIRIDPGEIVGHLLLREQGGGRRMRQPL